MEGEADCHSIPIPFFDKENAFGEEEKEEADEPHVLLKSDDPVEGEEGEGGYELQIEQTILLDLSKQNWARM